MPTTSREVGEAKRQAGWFAQVRQCLLAGSIKVSLSLTDEKIITNLKHDVKEKRKRNSICLKRANLSEI